MFPPRTPAPLPPPRPISSGPSTLGRVLAIIIGLLLLLGGVLLWPTFRALNDAFVTAIEDWRAMVGGAFLIFAAFVLIGIVRLLFASAHKSERKAQQAAIVKLPDGMPAHVMDVRDGRLIASLLARSLDQYHAAKIADASRPFPQLHTYSNHLHNTNVPQVVDVAPPALPPSIPTFGELLDRGQIGPGRSLILGYAAETGQALTGSWADLYSCGVGALQGAGKSWLVAFLLSQSAAAGGRLIICDPHAGSDESLSNRIAALAPAFMCDVAYTDEQILDALRLANDKLERRKRGQGGDWPIICAVDEWSSLLRGKLGDELPGLVQNISEQGRKYNVNCILSAQGWTVAAAGIVRNRITAHYCLRQRDQEARYQLGLRAVQMPDDIPALPDATGYLLPSRGTLTKVVIPKMDAASIARAGAMIDKPAAAGTHFGFTLPTAPLQPVVASGKPNGSQNVAGSVAATSAAQSATLASPEATRAAGLFVAGKSPAEIVAELRGVKSNEGSRYQQALNEVLDLIRQGVQS